MKKLHVFLAIMCMSAMVFAQTRNLKDADRALKNGKLDKALTAIKLAMEEPENQAIANAWFSQGKIYTALMTTKEPEFAELEKNPKLALESFSKAFTMDESGKIRILGSVEVHKLIGASYDAGAKYYEEKKYAEAAEAFENSVNAGKLIEIVDTMGLFNTALCADLAQNKPMAKEYYLKLVEIKADQPTVYTSLAAIYKDENDKANAAKYADLAVELFPDNYNALINAASIHLMLQNAERAQKILSDMAEKYADNPIVFFALGVAYDQIKMPNDAEKAYIKAIELKPDYFDAIFNLGAFYVSQGVAIKAEADDIPPTETQKYDAMIERSNDMFKKAVPRLEQALEMKPNDIPVMSTLKDLYVHLRIMDKANAMDAEIKKLENK